MAENGEPEQQQLDTDQDRYPTFRDVLHAILDDADFPDEPIERCEVTTLANGEATYRYWLSRAEEPEGGLLPPP